MVAAWCQSADFQNTDLGEVDLATAMKMLDEHDWAGALEQAERLEEGGDQWCPPTIGFGDVKLGIRVFAIEKDLFAIDATLPPAKKILGLFPAGTNACYEGLSLNEAKRGVELFITNDYPALREGKFGERQR